MKIKNFEFYSLIFFITESCLFGYIINDSIKLVNTSMWIIPILGSILGLPILKMYLYLFNQNKKITDLTIEMFGKFGKIINYLFMFFIIIYISSLFLVLINFICTQYLYDTPPLFIILITILTILYLIKNKTNALFKTSLFFSYIMFILFIITFLSLINQVNIKNIMPFFNFKITNFLKALIDYIAYSTSPILIILFFNKKDTKKLNNKSIIKVYLLANLINLIIVFLIISIFGINLCLLYQFPGYHVLKRVFEGTFIDRIEKIFAIYWIISMFIPISFYSNILTIYFKNKKIYIALPFILIISYFLFKNINLLKEWNENIFPIILNCYIFITFLIYFKTKKKTT